MNRENGQYKISKDSLVIVKELLKGKPSEYWPFFGQQIIRGDPYFKLFRGISCTTYVDVPNAITQKLIWDLLSISARAKNIKEFYKKARPLIDEYNNYLRREVKKYFGSSLKWLSYEIDYHPYYERAGIRVKINWKKFMDFIESYPKEKIRLYKKYRYLLFCKYPYLQMGLRKEFPSLDEVELERVQKIVKELSQKDIEEILEEINNCIYDLEKTRKKLTRISKRNGVHLMALFYLLQMVESLRALKFLIERGCVSSCYREMRYILENLAWNMMIDILLFRELKEMRENNLYINPYAEAAKEWFEEAKKLRATINNINDFKRRTKKFLDEINVKENIDELEEIIFHNISYSIFLLLTGRCLHEEEKKKINKEFIPTYSALDLSKIAKRRLESIFKDQPKIVNGFITKFSKKDDIFPSYPSTTFVLSFIDRLFSTKLQYMYDEYSFFTHSYFASWHIIPFSSVLEFKILKEEIKKFVNAVMELLKKYVDELKDKRK